VKRAGGKRDKQINCEESQTDVILIPHALKETGVTVRKGALKKTGGEREWWKLGVNPSSQVSMVKKGQNTIGERSERKWGKTRPS